ncbi:MAG TPA: ABC transporter permease, partial [Chthoniobacterales bacterium]|nr:ABC transporter permease [Chthoniobacterales bacterium]
MTVEFSALSERFHWLSKRCSRLVHRSKREAALDTELQFHFDQLVAEFQAEGMPEREARLAAQREFGAVSAYREEIRDAWRPPQLADFWRSVRFAVRSLSRTPGFTALAVVTLAFGIGGNTMMYSALNTVALKPLPYPDSAQLERFDRATPQNPEGRVSPADFLDLRRQVQDYGEIAGYSLGDAGLSDKGQPAEMVRAMRSSANMFSTLGVRLQLGRDFLPHEEVPGNDRVVIISQRCWQNRFGGSADVIGRSIRVDGEPHQIVGVLPPSFNDWRHLGAIDFFRPLALDEQKATDRYSPILRIFGRRSENISRAEAGSMIANFGARLARDFPEIHAGTSWRTVSLTETVQGKNARATLGMCIGLSAFVLLIACSNLANLLLARTMGRAREFAVRSALGASRGQLLRPLIVESLLLAVAGGVGAIIVASWGADWLSMRSMGDNGERVILIFDWRVFTWA